MSAKRSDYISWDEYFMGVAHLSGMRSKDPNTQVGACIVSPDNKILSMGYNGFPKGCSDDEFPWERENANDRNLTKYPFVTHSELNAILNYRGGSLEGTKLYVRRGSARWYMTAISMRELRPTGQPSGCLTRPE